ncbi:MAG: outer membrane beta-barrel protein [Bacteroidetes bacterium]|nr:outer membrane beta-barrel protein [Bacteroidota bacterium]
MLNIWGGGQQTWILNRDDSGWPLFSNNQTDTKRPGFGVEYIDNFDFRFGYSVGLTYSQQGQMYKGVYTIDTATKKTAPFTSHAYLDYIKLPLIFRFNTSMDDDQYFNICIYGGMQFAYLINTNVQTDPTDSAMPSNFKYRKLFNPYDITMIGGLQINVYPSPKWGFSAGFRYDRGFVNVENKNYDFRAQKLPASLYFPISLRKDITPSVDDAYTRDKTTNSTINIYVSLIIPLKDFERVNNTPFLEDNNNSDDGLQVK